MKPMSKVLVLALCYGAMSEVVSGQQCPTDPAQLPQHAFRSYRNGDWSSRFTWEEYHPENNKWCYPADTTPDYTFQHITIQSYHTGERRIDTVRVTKPVLADQLTVHGRLEVRGPDGHLTVTKGDNDPYDLVVWGELAVDDGGLKSERLKLLPGASAHINSGGKFITLEGPSTYSASLSSGLINNLGDILIDGILRWEGGSVTGNPFRYGPLSMLILNRPAYIDSIGSGRSFWPDTSGPVSVSVEAPLTMNVPRTIRGICNIYAPVTNAYNLSLITRFVDVAVDGSFDSAPLYGEDATLRYWGHGTHNVHNVGYEWSSGTAVGRGVPKNVQVRDITVNMPSGPRRCPGSLVISGTLILSTSPGANLSVGGDFTTSVYGNGVLIPSSKEVTFDGTTEQNLSGQVTFDHLTINNPAGIRWRGDLDDSIKVNQTLTFLAGNFWIGGVYWYSHPPLVLSGEVIGASPTRHIVTINPGVVMRAIAGGDSFQFPIGPTATSYNPLTIALDPDDPTEVFSVGVDSIVHYPISYYYDSLFVQRTWTIEEATEGGNHAALTFQWSGAEEGAKFTRNASSAYLHDVEVTQNSVASGTDPYVVSTTGGFPCTDFARYTVGNTGALTHEETITGLIAGNDGPTPLDSVTTLMATVTTGTNVYFTWSFGDGASDSGDVVTHTYAAAGNYTAIVTATNTLGSVSDTTVVNIFIAPIAGLTASNDGPTPLGSATTLTATVEEGSRVNYAWNFDDGTPADSGAVVNHTYRAVGIYLAVVTATNAVTTLMDTTKVTVTPTTIVEESKDEIPTAFMLAQNYPNPFNPVTTIQFALPRQSHVRLKVYNTFGAEVAILVDQEMAAGTYKISWDASRLASGFYLYRLEAEGFAQTKKLLLMK